MCLFAKLKLFKKPESYHYFRNTCQTCPACTNWARQGRHFFQSLSLTERLRRSARIRETCESTRLGDVPFCKTRPLVTATSNSDKVRNGSLRASASTNFTRFLLSHCICTHHHKQEPPATRERKFTQNFDVKKKEKCKFHIVPLRCSEIDINFNNNSTITTL